MKVASVADVKAKLSGYQSASREGPVVVTRNGKAETVLLALEDDDELEQPLIADSPRLRAIFDAARRRVRTGKGVPHGDLLGDAGAATTHKKRRIRRPGRHETRDKSDDLRRGCFIYLRPLPAGNRAQPWPSDGVPFFPIHLSESAHVHARGVAEETV